MDTSTSQTHRGLGISVKESDLDGLPYEPLPYRQYRHADGSWKGLVSDMRRNAVSR